MRILIGFTGPAGVGKTTAAKFGCESGFSSEVLSFATPLKKCISELFDFSHNQLHTFDGKETVDKRYGVTPRRVMQRFGTEFVRSTVPDLWTILMHQKLSESDSHLTLIDDVRFEDEVNLVRELGGTVVHVYGRTDFGEHKSEQGVIKYSTDMFINNICTLKDLKNSVHKIAWRLHDER